jgi:hypothetical protein
MKSKEAEAAEQTAKTNSRPIGGPIKKFLRALADPMIFFLLGAVISRRPLSIRTWLKCGESTRPVHHLFVVFEKHGADMVQESGEQAIELHGKTAATPGARVGEIMTVMMRPLCGIIVHPGSR